MKVVMTSVLMALTLSSAAYAHEGHENAPGALKASHGGVVKAGEQLNLEYVVSGTQIKLYPVSHEGKDLAPSAVKISGTSKSPKAKEENLKLTVKDGAYVGDVDFKGAYRVEMKVVAEISGKKDSFKFQVEK